MIQSIAEFLNIILTYFYQLTGNYGVAIILLTLLVKIVTYPLTHKQLKSTKKMQDVQPEIKKLQEKYKDDKETLNKKTMELWKEHKVNPAAGCLPLLIQFPVLIAIFRLLQDTSLIEEAIPGFNPMFLGMNMILPDPFYILPLLAGLTTFLQQKMMMTDTSQKAMLIAMPLMITFFSIRFPAGLVVYWVINNLISIIHHLILNKPTTKGALEKN